MQIAKVVGLLHHCIKVKGIVFLLLAPAQRELDGWDSSLETLYNERRPRRYVVSDGAMMVASNFCVARKMRQKLRRSERCRRACAMNDGPDAAAGDGAPAVMPVSAQLDLHLFPLPNPAPNPNRTSMVQDQTRRRHDANNLMFIAYLFDVDAILVHEPCRLHFQEADQLDQTHPTTRASRANLKRFVRHALSTGIPIDLNRLPSNFSRVT